MSEIKYDIKRGADTYRLIHFVRLKSWILKGIIKRKETLVWRSGLSGWRKPEELPELESFFYQQKNSYFRKKRRSEKPILFLKIPIKNILIIDDEKDLCWLLSNFLKLKGYNIFCANTIREGTLYLKKTPDLVFLDLKLPDGDGMNILPKIKQICPETLVIIISAYGSEERREEAKKKGVCEFINKPFTEEKILTTINQFQKIE